MADDYVALANVTLSASATTVTFSSISGSYRDLVFVASDLKTTPNAGNINIRFNGTTTEYRGVRMTGDGSAAQSATDGTDRINKAANTPNAGSEMLILHIFDYAQTNKHKLCLLRTDNATTRTETAVWRWVNTAAITQVQFFLSANSYASGTTFALYGIRA